VEVSDEWQAAMVTALARGGVCLVVGATDVGKSTFCGLLAQRAAAAGTRTAVLDSDTGQQDIGPPACIGMAWAQPEATRLDELPLAGMHFVGATSPLGHLLELVAGLAALRRSAYAQGTAFLVVDTTGLVEGPGLGLKWAKVSALRPRTLVAIQRGDELEPLLVPYRTRERPTVLRVTPSPLARARSPQVRAARRQEMFARYFTGARTQAIPMERVSWEGLPLLAGTPLPEVELEALAKAWGVRVLHAESGPAGRVAVTAGEPWRAEGWRVLSVASFDRLLVGLVEADGNTAGAGILLGWPDGMRAFRVVTPARAAGVRTLRVGYLRVDPRGTELGSVRW